MTDRPEHLQGLRRARHLPRASSTARSRAASAAPSSTTSGARRIAVGRDARLSSPEIAGGLHPRARAARAARSPTSASWAPTCCTTTSRATTSTAAPSSPPPTIRRSGTAIKMVRQGAFALSGDAGIKEIREAVAAPAATPTTPPAEARARSSRAISDDYARALPVLHRRRARCRASRSCSTPATAWARSARAPSSRACPIETVRMYFELDGTLPQPSRRSPRWRRTAARSWRACVAEGADLGHRLGRRRRPLLLHRRHGRVRARRLRDRAPRRGVLPASEPGAHDRLRRAGLAGGRRTAWRPRAAWRS